MDFSIESARKFLELAGVFYGADEDDPKLAQTLNLNDTFAWASADSEYVPDAELPEVARLFWLYGFNGITYWASKKWNDARSEFFDITRGIDFVAQEEKLRKEVPDTSERAYTQVFYMLGAGRSGKTGEMVPTEKVR